MWGVTLPAVHVLLLAVAVRLPWLCLYPVCPQVSADLVDAHLARRALDYLVGFSLSPLLWRRLSPAARSAGLSPADSEIVLFRVLSGARRRLHHVAMHYCLAVCQPPRASLLILSFLCCGLVCKLLVCVSCWFLPRCEGCRALTLLWGFVGCPIFRLSCNLLMPQ